MKKNILFLLFILSSFSTFANGIPDRITHTFNLPQNLNGKVKEVSYHYSGEHPSFDTELNFIHEGHSRIYEFSPNGNLKLSFVDEVDTLIEKNYFYSQENIEIIKVHCVSENHERLDYNIENIYQGDKLIIENLYIVHETEKNPYLYPRLPQIEFGVSNPWATKRVYEYDERGRIRKVTEIIPPKNTMSEIIGSIYYFYNGNSISPNEIFGTYDPQIFEDFMNDRESAPVIDYNEDNISDFEYVQCFYDSTPFKNMEIEDINSFMRKNTGKPPVKMYKIYEGQNIKEIWINNTFIKCSPQPCPSIEHYSFDENGNELLFECFYVSENRTGINRYENEYQNKDRMDNWTVQRTTWERDGEEILYNIIKREIEYY